MSNGTLPLEATDSLDAGGALVLIILGLPINSYVLHLILAEMKAGVISDIFPLNLTICEVLLCAGSLVFPVQSLARLSGFDGALGFVSGLLMTGLPMFNCCICLERYLAVLHPLVFLRFRPLRYRVACSATIWALVLFFCLLCSFARKLSYVIWICVCLPLYVVTLFCCLSILRALRQPGPGDRGREEDGAKMRAFKIVSVILMSEMVGYLPLTILMAVNSSLTQAQSYLGRSSVFIFLVSTCFTHPLLYLHRAGKLPCLPAF